MKIKHLIENPQKLFLLDGFGAVLSAIFLGVVLVQWNSYFGMPVDILKLLAGIALVFALYSLGNYLFLSKKWRPFLIAIAIANTVYCGLTLGLVIYYYKVLTSLGMLYFVLEMMIIVILVSVERRAILNRDV